MADINAASPATAAHLDCAPNSVTKFAPPKSAAIPSLTATRSASPLAMNAEPKATQKAKLLLIAPSQNEFRLLQQFSKLKSVLAMVT
jgi:hypothetical protein